MPQPGSPIRPCMCSACRANLMKYLLPRFIMCLLVLAEHLFMVGHTTRHATGLASFCRVRLNPLSGSRNIALSMVVIGVAIALTFWP